MRPLSAALVIAAAIGLLAGCAGQDRPIRARLERADELLGRDKMTRARSEIEAAIRLEPSRSDTYRDAIGLYVQHERRREAASLLERFVELGQARKLDEELSREDLAHLHSMLGEVCQKERLLVRAEDAYRTALALAPDSAPLANNLAYFYAEEGIKLDEGLRLARKAVALAPTDGNVVDTLGWVEYGLGRYEAAAHTLARAVRLMPDQAALRYHLGAAYARLGREFDARVELKKALILDSKTHEAARLLRTLGKQAPDRVGD